MPFQTFLRLSTWLRRGAAPASLCLLLSACGGGSDADAGHGGGTYNLDTAISRVLQDGLQINGLSGSAGGTSFSLSMAFTPLPDALFEGVQRKAARQTLVISGGGSTNTTTATNYFRLAPYADLGAIGEDGSLDVSTPTGNLPTAGRVGDSGPLSTTVSYADATKQRIDAMATTTWSLEADSIGTVLACLRAEVRETGSTALLSTRQCFRLNSAGGVLGVVVTISDGSTSIVFR